MARGETGYSAPHSLHCSPFTYLMRSSPSSGRDLVDGGGGPEDVVGRRQDPHAQTHGPLGKRPEVLVGVRSAVQPGAHRDVELLVEDGADLGWGEARQDRKSVV